MKKFFILALAFVLLSQTCFSETLRVESSSPKIYYEYELVQDKISNPRIVSAVKLVDPNEAIREYEVEIGVRNSLGLFLSQSVERERTDILKEENLNFEFPLPSPLDRSVPNTVTITAFIAKNHYIQEFYDTEGIVLETGIIPVLGDGIPAVVPDPNPNPGPDPDPGPEPAPEPAPEPGPEPGPSGILTLAIVPPSFDSSGKTICRDPENPKAVYDLSSHRVLTAVDKLDETFSLEFFDVEIGVRAEVDDAPANQAGVEADIMLVLDKSGSMKWDFPRTESVAKTVYYVNRGEWSEPKYEGATITKWKSALFALETFFEKISDKDRIGAVKFDTKNFLVSGISTDHSSVFKTIQGSYPNIKGNEGTCILSGMYPAFQRLSSVPKNRERIIILLSDGHDTNPHLLDSVTGEDKTVFSLSESIKLAKKFGVKIYVIGIGSDEYMKTPFEHTTLSDVAKQTGGKYFFAMNHSQLVASLQKLASEINKRPVFDSLNEKWSDLVDTNPTLKNELFQFSKKPSKHLSPEKFFIWVKLNPKKDLSYPGDYTEATVVCPQE